LDEQGQAENTAVIYLSDNAVFWGEHRLSGKMQLYEEAIRVPMALRYPPLTSRPRLENRLVANIDIAPTLYELAGQPIPPEVEGRSLVPLVRGIGIWRRDLLLEARSTPPGFLDEEGVFFDSWGIHTERYVYLQNQGDRDELYDLATDPHQLQNQASHPAFASVQRDLQARLGTVRPPQRTRAWAAQCTNPTGPLDENQILRRVKQGNLRVIYFDCGQSWIYPLGGKQPGWMIIPADAPEWAKGKLSQSNPKAANGFWVYADDGGARWPQGGRVRVSPSDVSWSKAGAAAPVDLPVSFQGGLTLLGYQLEQTQFKPGDTVSVVTAWRVDQVPGQLISLMAHLGPSEQAVATGDSLGVPIEYMGRGDVFLQRHTFALPANAPAGMYWFQTGVYGFENDMRWPVRDTRVKGNRVMLGPLQVKP
jgi:hypothetical protein